MSVLLHSRITRYNSTTIPPMLRERGPVSDLIDGLFPDDFLDVVKLRPGTKTWSIEMEYGAHKLTRAVRFLPVKRTGQVSLKWAARLKHALSDFYGIWLFWRGDVIGHPPDDCENEVHKPWHQYRTEASFMPEDGYWRCVGCGWLYSPDGKRVRERYYSDNT